MAFTKGKPGTGRKPLGSVHQRTLLLKSLKSQHKTEETFASALIKMAEDGNSTCLTIVADRLWKKPKAVMPRFILPDGNTKLENAEAIIQGMLSGQIAPDAANVAMNVLRGATELSDLKELNARLKELERK